MRNSFPTRRPCVDCKAVTGPLRRACPYCSKPVCEDCYPMDHACTKDKPYEEPR